MGEIVQWLQESGRKHLKECVCFDRLMMAGKMSMLLGFNRGGNNNNNNGNQSNNKHVAQAPDPDVLMQKMDQSIASVEYRRATAQLAKYSPPSQHAAASSNGKSMRAKDESVLLANKS